MSWETIIVAPLYIGMIIIGLWLGERHRKARQKQKKIVPEDGMKAYDQGFKMYDNPFPKHTPDYSIWRDDWLFCAGRFK